jgi:hypothetical protein
MADYRIDWSCRLQQEEDELKIEISYRFAEECEW